MHVAVAVLHAIRIALAPQRAKACAHREICDFLLRAIAIGRIAVIAIIDKVLVRKYTDCLAQYADSAEARIKYADRLLHAGYLHLMSNT